MLNLNFATYPVLTTQRLVLRRPAATDAPLIHELRANPEINRYIDRPRSTGVQDAEAFIEKIDGLILARQSRYWVITLGGDDRLIGTVCVWGFDPVNDTVEIGYELMTSQQGRGIMDEAVSSVIDYCFKQINAKVITAYVSADNGPSLRLLSKLNFVIDDTAQTDEHNMVVYSLKRPY